MQNKYQENIDLFKEPLVLESTLPFLVEIYSINPNINKKYHLCNLSVNNSLEFQQLYKLNPYKYHLLSIEIYQKHNDIDSVNKYLINLCKKNFTEGQWWYIYIYLQVIILFTPYTIPHIDNLEVPALEVQYTIQFKKILPSILSSIEINYITLDTLECSIQDIEDYVKEKNTTINDRERTIQFVYIRLEMYRYILYTYNIINDNSKDNILSTDTINIIRIKFIQMFLLYFFITKQDTCISNYLEQAIKLIHNTMEEISWRTVQITYKDIYENIQIKYNELNSNKDILSIDIQNNKILNIRSYIIYILTRYCIKEYKENLSNISKDILIMLGNQIELQYNLGILIPIDSNNKITSIKDLKEEKISLDDIELQIKQLLLYEYKYLNIQKDITYKKEICKKINKKLLINKNHLEITIDNTKLFHIDSSNYIIEIIVILLQKCYYLTKKSIYLWDIQIYLYDKMTFIKEYQENNEQINFTIIRYFSLLCLNKNIQLCNTFQDLFSKMKVVHIRYNNLGHLFIDNLLRIGNDTISTNIIEDTLLTNIINISNTIEQIEQNLCIKSFSLIPGCTILLKHLQSSFTFIQACCHLYLLCILQSTTENFNVFVESMNTIKLRLKQLSPKLFILQSDDTDIKISYTNIQKYFNTIYNDLAYRTLKNIYIKDSEYNRSVDDIWFTIPPNCLIDDTISSINNYVIYENKIYSEEIGYTVYHPPILTKKLLAFEILILPKVVLFQLHYDDIQYVNEIIDEIFINNTNSTNYYILHTMIYLTQIIVSKDDNTSKIKSIDKIVTNLHNRIQNIIQDIYIENILDFISQPKVLVDLQLHTRLLIVHIIRAIEYIYQINDSTVYILVSIVLLFIYLLYDIYIYIYSSQLSKSINILYSNITQYKESISTIDIEKNSIIIPATLIFNDLLLVPNCRNKFKNNVQEDWTSYRAQQQNIMRKLQKRLSILNDLCK